MTVYTGITQNKTIRKAYTWREILNISLLVLVAAAIVGNIFISNSLASRRFAIELKKKELHAAGNSLAARETEIGGSASMANLLSLVQRNGMVPDKQGEAFFLTSGVAYTNVNAQEEN